MTVFYFPSGFPLDSWFPCVLSGCIDNASFASNIFGFLFYFFSAVKWSIGRLSLITAIASHDTAVRSFVLFKWVLP